MNAFAILTQTHKMAGKKSIDVAFIDTFRLITDHHKNLSSNNILLLKKF